MYFQIKKLIARGTRQSSYPIPVRGTPLHLGGGTYIRKAHLYLDRLPVESSKYDRRLAMPAACRYVHTSKSDVRPCCFFARQTKSSTGTDPQSSHKCVMASELAFPSLPNMCSVRSDMANPIARSAVDTTHIEKLSSAIGAANPPYHPFFFLNLSVIILGDILPQLVLNYSIPPSLFSQTFVVFLSLQLDTGKVPQVKVFHEFHVKAICTKRCSSEDMPRFGSQCVSSESYGR